MSDMVLLQRYQRQQQNLADLLKTLSLLKREEELGQESGKGVVKSLIELKDMNKALAAAAHQRRQQDESQLTEIKGGLTKQLEEAQALLEKEREESKRLRKEAKDAKLQANDLKHDLEAQQRRTARIQADLEASQREVAEQTSEAKRLRQELNELQSKNHALQLEKDRVAQRFVAVTQQMAAVAGNQFKQMQALEAELSDGSSDGSLGSRDGAADPRGRDGDAPAADVAPRDWSVSQVGEWLDAVGLGRHRVAFAQNSVDGDMLFDLGAGDLDEVGVVDHMDRQKLVRERDRLAEGDVSALRRAAASRGSDGGARRTVGGGRSGDARRRGPRAQAGRRGAQGRTRGRRAKR